MRLVQPAAKKERLVVRLAELLDDPVGGAVILEVLVLDVHRPEADAADAGLTRRLARDAGVEVRAVVVLAHQVVLAGAARAAVVDLPRGHREVAAGAELRRDAPLNRDGV